MKKDQGKCLRAQTLGGSETLWRHGAGGVGRQAVIVSGVYIANPCRLSTAKAIPLSCQPIASAPHPHHPRPGRGLSVGGIHCRDSLPRIRVHCLVLGCQSPGLTPTSGMTGGIEGKQTRASAGEARKAERGWAGRTRAPRPTRRKSPGWQVGQLSSLLSPPTWSLILYTCAEFLGSCWDFSIKAHSLPIPASLYGCLSFLHSPETQLGQALSCEGHDTCK